MYITYEQLMKIPAMEKVTLFAGKEGLYRTIQWTQTLDIDEIEAWVNPGSLIFITGVGIAQWKKSLVEIVEEAIAEKAAGIIIYVGAYIDKIPEELRAVCDREKFPLFQAPVEVRTVDISYQIAELLFSRQKQADMVSNIINDIYINVITDNTIYMMEKQGFQGKEYQCIILQMNAGDILVQQRNLQDMENMIHTIFQKYGVKVICRAEYNSVVIAAAYSQASHNYQKGQEIFADIVKDFEKLFPQKCLSAMAGGMTEDVRQIGISMKQAIFTREIVKKEKPETKLTFYRDLGIYRILWCNDIEEEKKQFVTDYLGKLVNRENEELLFTLDCYIRNGQNTTKTAEELFIHLNTMKYRLKKIEELLGRNLKDSETIYSLYVALAIYKVNQ